jgi:hypothetical protein
LSKCKILLISSDVGEKGMDGSNNALSIFTSLLSHYIQ